MKDVQTDRETMVPRFIGSSRDGLAAPSKTPSAQIGRLNPDISTALETPEVMKKRHELNEEARASSPRKQPAADSPTAGRRYQAIE